MVLSGNIHVKGVKISKTAKKHNFSISHIFPDMPGFELSEKVVSAVSELKGFFGNSVNLNEHLCQFLACWQFSPCCGEISANSTRLILVEKIFSGSYKTSSRDIWSAVVR